MRMHVLIKPVTLSEISSFYSLFSKVLRSEFPGYTEETIKYLLTKIYTEENFYYWTQQNLKTIIGAKISEKFVGFAVIDEPYGGVSLLRWLGIAPEYQRHGIGRDLIDAWEKIAITQQVHKMEVAAQPQAKDFYIKVGLVEEGKRVKSYFGIDQYIFGKVIA